MLKKIRGTRGAKVVLFLSFAFEPLFDLNQTCKLATPPQLGLDWHMQAICKSKGKIRIQTIVKATVARHLRHKILLKLYSYIWTIL